MTDYAKQAMKSQTTEFVLTRDQVEAIILDTLKVTGAIEARFLYSDKLVPGFEDVKIIVRKGS